MLIVKISNKEFQFQTGMTLHKNQDTVWKIISVGLGKKPTHKTDESDDYRLIRDCKVEHINGENILLEGDRLVIQLP